MTLSIFFYAAVYKLARILQPENTGVGKRCSRLPVGALPYHVAHGLPNNNSLFCCLPFTWSVSFIALFHGDWWLETMCCLNRVMTKQHK